jgi:predicted membrane metal-binding protein
MTLHRITNTTSCALDSERQRGLIRWFAPRRPKTTLKGWILTLTAAFVLAWVASVSASLAFTLFAATGLFLFLWELITRRRS